MLGIYFSGTGNSKYCINKFLNEYDNSSKAVSIEDENILEEIMNSEDLVISYPVQYSNLPIILRDFIDNNKQIWRDKKIFIISTMGLFSGDGTGVLARLLKSYGAEIIGGIHIKMPNSISDEKPLKRPLHKYKQLVKKADLKIKNAVHKIKNDRPPKQGLSSLSHILGLLGQRLYFKKKMSKYSNELKINKDLCVGCKLCVKLCPMKNISVINGEIVPSDKCTMCYRCINKCPKQAITLLGTKVFEQCIIEKYI